MALPIAVLFKDPLNFSRVLAGVQGEAGASRGAVGGAQAHRGARPAEAQGTEEEGAGCTGAKSDDDDKEEEEEEEEKQEESLLISLN